MPAHGHLQGQGRRPRRRTRGSPASSRTARSNARSSTRAISSSASASIPSSCCRVRGRTQRPSSRSAGGRSPTDHVPFAAQESPRRRRGRRPNSKPQFAESDWSDADDRAASRARSATQSDIPAAGLTAAARRRHRRRAAARREPRDRRRRRAHVPGDDAVAGERAERTADLERPVDDGICAAGGDRRGAARSATPGRRAHRRRRPADVRRASC